MPFIRASSIRVYTGLITYFTAGLDAVSTCRTEDTLKATVIGDLTNHKLEWEQLEGDPVSYTTPTDQTTVSYTYTIKDDKKFRLWIDKGSIYEQYDDVWSYQTPTSSAPRSGSHVTGLNFKSYSGTTSGMNSATGWQIAQFPSRSESDDGYFGQDLTKALTWTAPSNNGAVVGYKIERWENGSWVEYGNVTANDRYLVVENGHNYRIKTYFYEPDTYGSLQEYEATSSIVRVDDKEQTWATSSIGCGAHVSSYNHGITSYSVLERYIITNNPVPTEAPRSGAYVTSYNHGWSGYSVVERFVTQFSAPSDTEAPRAGAYVTSYNHQITSYNVLELVNISIGG